MKKFLSVLLLSIPFVMNAQDNTTTITGRVVDYNSKGLPFASIAVKGAGSGTASDSVGNFSLATSQKFPFTLSVSSVGFTPLQFVVKNNSNISNLQLQLQSLFQSDTVVITSRRRREVLQDVPIPITVIGGKQVDDAGAFNVNRVKELIPSVQLYSSNPRNTGVSIRGLGSPFGLTNDGLDPGVGIYVDGVYYARPAAATLDFIDLDQIEVLRGPQGTLYGKNTTAGAISITSRKPNFKQGGVFEVSYGNFGYVQAKASITGAISKKLAARASFTGTQRDGLVENVRTLKNTNDINNLGGRIQFLFKASDKTSITLSGDATFQKPDGYAQVVAGVAPTKRAGYRQFDTIIASLNYQLPSRNAFDRKIDHDVPWNSGNDLGGVSLNIDSKIGFGTLTSTTAYRYWDWRPSNDRDFTGLEALAKSQNPSKHHNWSQEFRYAGQVSSALSGVVGLFYLNQEVTTNGLEQAGKDQWRFSQSTTNTALWQTPGLFNGFGINTYSNIKSQSAAVFANVDWEVATGLHILPGIRFNYDKKDVIFDRKTFGGLDTATFSGTTAQKTTLQGWKNDLYRKQYYVANANENNLTYQLTLAYKFNKRINAYATYSTSYKPVGVNVAGLPNINGRPDSSVAVIKPEYTTSQQVGFKTTPIDNFTLNITFHNTDIKDYQTNVQSPQLNVNRGYIANAEKVNVKGIELEANIKVNNHFTFYAGGAYTDAKYVTFTNAPLPLEKTGLKTVATPDKPAVDSAFVDISGQTLPGISKWAASLGGEFTTPAAFLGKAGNFFVAAESFYRSFFSSSPTPSPYLNIDGYALVNGRIGFRAANGLSAYVWGRNLLNKNYYEQLLVAGGNSGQYAGVLGDQRTYGVTLRYRF